uniref:CD276 antigen n=1 Tax=Spermophilus dauricus TaxID=99837 RepID=A0A8C9PJX0_SPEDA
HSRLALRSLLPGHLLTFGCSHYRTESGCQLPLPTCPGPAFPLTSSCSTSPGSHSQESCRWGQLQYSSNPCPSSLPTPPVLSSGAVEVQVPEDPVVALVGTDATLHWSFSPEPGFSLVQLNLIWQLTDTKQLVHSFAEGQDQGSAYANRTMLFPDLLAQGNASLRLQGVRVADEGSFTCFVSIRDFGSAAVSLQVAAPYSKPSMTLEPSKDLRPGDMVTITCFSHRGYPEAEVIWQDGQGTPLTGNVTTSQMANEQGLFDVRSVLRVVLGADGTYSCLVRNPVLQQDAHGSVTITDPVVALVGTDATLHCSFSPELGFSLAQLNLIWQLMNTKQLVHSFAEGRDQGSALPRPAGTGQRLPEAAGCVCG